MSQVLVFSCDGDPALVTARQVADRTIARLQTEGHGVTALLSTSANRAHLEQALPMQEGLAAFSHGREDALLDGARTPILDSDNIHLLAGKWAWIFACRTARDLGGLALAGGARCFAGFEVALIVDWDEAEIPAQIQSVFWQLVSEVPSLMASGCMEEQKILAALRPLVDEVLDFCMDSPDSPGGLEITAQQMLRRLVVLGQSDIECLARAHHEAQV